MWHNLDNFGGGSLSLLGLVYPKKSFYYDFFGAFSYVCAESGQFQLPNCHNIAQRNFFLHLDNSQLG